MNPSTLFPTRPLLIVDDEPEVLRSLSLTLQRQGITHIVTCSDGREVAGLLAQQPFEALLLDLTMPFVSGEEILTLVREQYPEIPVIVITARDDVDTAVRCMKTGAEDYVVKPVEPRRLVSGLQRLIEVRQLRAENRRFRDRVLSGELRHPEAFADLITVNSRMQAIFQYLEAIAISHQPVLITGETGTGKELLVQALHKLTGHQRPLVAINVAGLEDTILSDTLFGHAPGAFTGAAGRREGLVEKAAGGILHLDEIGDLSSQSQIKLLRLLQEGEYFPLGSDTLKMAAVRVVASTNSHLEESMTAGRFRKDLFYRFAAHHIHLPPLRERREDIEPLSDHFIRAAAQEASRKPVICSEDARHWMMTYDFPGNVRELKMLIHDAVISTRSSRLTADDFKCRTGHQADRFSSASDETAASIEGPLPTLEETTRRAIQEAMRHCNQNQSQAARLLGISRQRLIRNLRGAD